MNRKDQDSIASLYVENINQMGAQSASKEEMANLLSKHPDANKPVETTYGLEAPEGYETSYDGDTLTIKRMKGTVQTTTMLRMGKKPVEEVQARLDYEVKNDQDEAKRASQGQALAKAFRNPLNN